MYGGEGLARLDGRVVLAPFVLPGERVRVHAESEKPGLVRARMLEVLEAAPERVAAPCPYFRRCGGCHYQHAPYEMQLRLKRAILEDELRRIGKIAAGGYRGGGRRAVGISQSRAVACRERRAGISRSRVRAGFARSRSARSRRRRSTGRFRCCAKCWAIRAGRGSCIPSSYSPTKRRCSLMFWRRIARSPAIFRLVRGTHSGAGRERARLCGRRT